jgi:hypothetical protein
LIEAQAVPAQPWPGTPLCTVHVTFPFVLPATAAKNCCVEFAPPDGGKNAYTGDTVTTAFVFGAEIKISALPLLETSASLLAVAVTGFAVGTAAGAG